MTDPMATLDSDEIAALQALHDALARQLAEGQRDGADDEERERLKREITALFRQVDRRLVLLARLKEDVKALVAEWKRLPAPATSAPSAPADAESPLPLPAFLLSDEAPPPATPVAAMSARTPTMSHASVRVDHLGASTFVAKGWSAISLGDFPKAEEELRRALELAPDDPEAGALVGWALMGQGRLDDAMLVCQEVLARSPDFPLARVNLGYICLRKGIYGEAIEHLAAAVRDEGGDRKAALYGTFYLGLVYLRREMFDDAVVFFRRALALGPNLLEAWFEMGRAHWLAGEREAAREAWRTGAASGKFNPWGRRCAEVLEQVDAGGEPPSVS